MTGIRCPACAYEDEVGRTIQDSDFMWSCDRCCRAFEVRTVFLARPSSVDTKKFTDRVRRGDCPHLWGKGEELSWPTIETFKRPESLSDRNDPEVLYARAYLRVRLAIGALGMLLPILLFWAEGPLLGGDWKVRDSFSAYYHHTSARDIFVGILVVVGFLLVTYVAGRLWSWEFLLSSFAGVMAIGVAFFPTHRSGVLKNGEVQKGAVLCGSESGVPPGCTAIQERYGELQVGAWHGRFALLFIGGLAVICFLAAYREWRHQRERGHPGWPSLFRSAAVFHLLCGGFMVAAGAWVKFGTALPIMSQNVTPVYAAEFVSVVAFGLSWSARGFDLVKEVIKELKGVIR